MSEVHDTPSHIGVEGNMGYVPQTAHEGQSDSVTGVINQTKPLGAVPPDVVVYPSQWNAGYAYAQGEIAEIKASIAKLESDGTEQAKRNGELKLKYGDLVVAERKAQARIAELEAELDRLRGHRGIPQSNVDLVAAERERMLRECITATKEAIELWRHSGGQAAGVVALKALARDFEADIRSGKP